MILALFTGLLMTAIPMLAGDGSVTVTATSPAPNPVCLGSVVMASFSGSATNPTDSACEITITNRIWNWTAVDDANHTIAPNQNGGTSATFSWTPGSCGTNKTLAATATVTFQGTNCHGAFSTNYSGSTSARVTAVQLQSISVSGATQIGTTTNWATMKTTNASDYVIITANLCPNDTNAATLLTWSGGLAVTNNPFQRRVSKTNAVETTVTASCCSTSMTVNVWIISAQIKSVAFTSDHHLMNTNNSDWTDTGILYGKPDWVANSSTNNPISQTMNTTVSVTTTVNVQPAGLPFDLTGSSSSAFLSFSKTGNGASGSDQGIAMNSTGNLPNSVGIQSGSISWTISAFGGAFNCASATSGAHKIYVTYGTPSGSVVTETRIGFVCNAASGKTALGDCADAVVASLSSAYDLNSSDVNGPNPVWLLHDGNHSSQCPGLALYVSKHFEMLGLGAGTTEYCHANADGTYGTSTPPAIIRSCASGDNGHPNPTPHADVSSSELLCHWDGSVPPGPNAFEAACLFNGYYYALGRGGNCKKNTPKEVVYWAFGTPPNIHWVYSTSPTAFANCGYNLWTEAP